MNMLRADIVPAPQGAERFECGVCWTIYDPAEGNPADGIAPGTAFGDLPGTYACPHCGTEKIKFLPTDRKKGEPRDTRAASGRFDPRRHGAANLEAGYRRVAAAMTDLPVANKALAVEILPVRVWNAYLATVAITPWAINAVLMPAGGQALPRPGSEIDVILPSGTYPFLAAELPETGRFLQLSLFSPPSEFADHGAARVAAEAALNALLHDPEAEQRRKAQPDRRAFLFGARGSTSGSPSGTP